MTFTYEAYCDILDAMGEAIRNPRPIGEPTQVDDVLARYREPAPSIDESQETSET